MGKMGFMVCSGVLVGGGVPDTRGPGHGRNRGLAAPVTPVPCFLGYPEAVERDDRGPDRSIDGLLEECLPDALAYARRHADPVILRQESCSDVVQSVCREFWVRRNEFEWRGLPAFRKLLFQKVLCKLVDRKLYYQRDKRDVRRQIRPESASGPSPIEQLQASLTSPSEAAMCGEDLLRFQRCFAQLSPDYQHVIRRSRLEGRTHTEIAEELGRKPGAVKVLLHRALIKLGLLMDAEARDLKA